MNGHVRKRGKTWSYVFDLGKVNGKRKQKEKGGFKSKKEAKEKLLRALNEFESPGGSFKDEKISLADFLDFWILNYVNINLKYRTQKKYKSDIENQFKPALGHYYLKNLNHEILQVFFIDKSESLSKNSIHSLYSTLSSAMNMAIKWGYIKHNPLKFVTLPKQENKVNIKALDKKELNLITDLFKNTIYYLPLIIGLHTGLRAGEIVALQWSDINFKNKTITVTKTMQYENSKWVLKEPKTKSSKRNIMINSTLLSELKKYKLEDKEKSLKFGSLYERNDYVNKKRDGSPITLNTLKYISVVVRKKLNMDFKFHSLRHAHATLLLESGVHPKIVQERLGHSKISTTLDIYSHISTNMQEKAMDLFEAALK